jgi:hypothetical protein
MKREILRRLLLPKEAFQPSYKAPMSFLTGTALPWFGEWARLPNYFLIARNS